MALIPHLWNDFDESLNPSNRWNNFNRGIYSHELDTFPSLLHPFYTGYHRYPRYHPGSHNASDSAAVRAIPRSSIGKDGFQVSMDVQQFAPNEITVKTIDNTIVVEAKHEERPDEHGYISREFKRRYTIPKGFNIRDVATQLSSDGVLTIKAPPEHKTIDGKNVRVLHIQQTGPARLNNGNQDSAKPIEHEPAKAPKK